MNSAKLLRYSMQLSMLKQLRSLKLISEAEYQLVEKKLKKDYGVISNITGLTIIVCVVKLYQHYGRNTKRKERSNGS